MKYCIALAALFPVTASAGLLSWLKDVVNDTTDTVGGVLSGGGDAAAAAPEINGSAAILAVALVVGIASLVRRARHNHRADKG